MRFFLVLMIHWYLSLFCQTFFLHRYSSHQMFKLNRFWEKFFYLLTFLTQGPSFLNPRAYATLHLQHHQFSDLNDDPHSPHHTKNIFTMMKSTLHQYQLLLKTPQTSHKLLTPQWKILDQWAQTWSHTIFWIVIYGFGYSFLVTEIWQYSFVVIHCLMGPIQGAIVNWFGHYWGYRNFNLSDKSKNSLPIDFLLMGELYQNNHHQNAKDIKFSKKWFEIDFTYPIIIMLKMFGILQFDSQFEEK